MGVLSRHGAQEIQLLPGASLSSCVNPMSQWPQFQYLQEVVGVRVATYALGKPDTQA